MVVHQVSSEALASLRCCGCSNPSSLMTSSRPQIPNFRCVSSGSTQLTISTGGGGFVSRSCIDVGSIQQKKFIPNLTTTSDGTKFLVSIFPSMRCFMATAGIAACTLLASCGPSDEQWEGYGQCMNDRSDRIECAREHGINSKLVEAD